MQKAFCLGIVLSFLASTASAADTPFGANLNVVASIRLTKQSDLNFGDVIRPMTGSSYSTISPRDPGAAVFKASGEAMRPVRAYVTTPSITLVNTENANQVVKVSQFRVGGALTEDATGKGSGSFDSTGRLYNIRVGARAHITADTKIGTYAGQAVLRLVYQ